jgi:divalent metal cation (Fe/Co/Zn/Cd) transporter
MTRADSLQSQLDVLTVLVAVVGLGLLVGGVAETFAILFSLGTVAFVLYRIVQRERMQ